MEHIVTGCKDCPMFFYNVDDRYGDETDCLHPNAIQQILVQNIDLDKQNNPITPDWCPLNKEPITIIKK